MDQRPATNIFFEKYTYQSLTLKVVRNSRKKNICHAWHDSSNICMRHNIKTIYMHSPRILQIGTSCHILSISEWIYYISSSQQRQYIFVQDRIS